MEDIKIVRSLNESGLFILIKVVCGTIGNEARNVKGDLLLCY